MPSLFDEIDSAAKQSSGKSIFDEIDEAAPKQKAEGVELADKVAAVKPNLNKNWESDQASIIAHPIDALEKAALGLKVLFTKKSPWERYKESVDKGFETNLPEIHRYEGSGVAGGTAAGVENTVNQAAAGVVSPGGASSILNPLAVLYGAPRFAAGGIESLKGIGKDKSTQENVEGALGGILGVAGGVGAGIHGVKGIKGAIPSLAESGAKALVQPELNKVPKTAEPSIVTQIDSASTKQTPQQANAAANEIAVKQPAPIGDVAPPNPVDKINQGIREEADKVVPAATLDEVVPGAKVEPDVGPAQKELLSRSGGEKALKSIKDALDSDKGFVQVTVWPDGYRNKDGSRVETFDAIDPDNPQPGGNGSTNRALLTEIGQDIPKLPKDFPDGQYTLDEFKKLVKEHEKAHEPSEATKARSVEEKAPSVDPEKKAYLDELLATKEITPEEHAAQLAELGAKPEVKPLAEQIDAAAPPQEEIVPTTGRKFSIPKELAKSNPRYSYGPKQFTLSFGSELDKALYIIADGAKRSASDGKFVELVTDHTGMTEAEARAAGRKIRDQIKAKAKSARDGETLSVGSPERLKAADRAVVNEVLGNEKKPAPEVVAPKPEEPPIQPRPAEAPPLIQDEVIPRAAAKVLEKSEIDAIISGERSAFNQRTGGNFGGGSGNPPITSAGGPTPYKPGLTRAGKGFEMARVALGTISGNIRDANRRIHGVLRNYEEAKSKLGIMFQDASQPASRLARKILSKQENDMIGGLLMSGKIADAKNYVATHTPYGVEFAHAIDAVRSGLDSAHTMLNEARNGAANYIKDYFPRQLISYAELRKHFGKDEQGMFDAALKRAEAKKGSPLTVEEQNKAVANYIAESSGNAGKPGFLKERTIKEINSDLVKFYEPWDVALDNYFSKVARDVTNRAYFGKFEPAPGEIFHPENGHFGKVINEEIANGRLDAKAQSIVGDNLRDRLKMDHQVQGAWATAGHKIRAATSAAYLGQIGTAIGQFGDFFQAALHTNLGDALKGYIKRPVKIRDFNLHEGNPETAMFSRNKSATAKAINHVMKLTIGIWDQFNKGGQANAIVNYYGKVAQDVNSPKFHRLAKFYSEVFPEQWPKMLEEIQTKDFRDGKIKDLPNAQMFLFNEISRIQAINPSEMAQGYNAAHPFVKSAYSLKSYMIKQLDVMRERGYEEVKRGNVTGGLGYLAAYAAVVGAAQNFSVSWLRDKLLDRETDTSDYFVGGMLQLFGLSRYSIMQMRNGEFGSAIAESVAPSLTLGKEAVNDLALARDAMSGRRSASTGLKSVDGLKGFLEQSETVKRFPLVGSLFYSRVGKGKTREDKNRSDKAAGKEQPNTLSSIKEAFIPKDAP